MYINICKYTCIHIHICRNIYFIYYYYVFYPSSIDWKGILKTIIKRRKNSPNSKKVKRFCRTFGQFSCHSFILVMKNCSLGNTSSQWRRNVEYIPTFKLYTNRKTETLEEKQWHTNRIVEGRILNYFYIVFSVQHQIPSTYRLYIQHPTLMYITSVYNTAAYVA